MSDEAAPVIVSVAPVSVSFPAPKPENLIVAQTAYEMSPTFPTESKGIALLTSALVQVEMTIAKADEVITALSQQMTTVQTQRIGLQAQKSMLLELKNRLVEIDKIVVTPNSDRRESIPA